MRGNKGSEKALSTNQPSYRTYGRTAGKGHGKFLENNLTTPNLPLGVKKVKIFEKKSEDPLGDP